MSSAVAIAGRGIPAAAALPIATAGLVLEGLYTGEGLTVFESRLSLDQGRVRPAGAAPTQGDWAMVLGCDTDGIVEALDVGDHIQVQQDLDVTGAKLIRADVTLRTPADVPAGQAWQVSILVDGEKIGTALGWPGKTRRITDLAADVSQIVGVHTLTIRLELVAT